MPALGLRLFQSFYRAGERYGYARQQHRFGAQQAFQFGNAVGRAFKIFAVRPHAYFGARIFHRAFADFVQRLDHIAAGKHDAVDFAFAFYRDFQAGRKRVGHRYAHTVQAAGKGIGAAAVFFVELTARVQLGEY